MSNLHFGEAKLSFEIELENGHWCFGFVVHGKPSSVYGLTIYNMEPHGPDRIFGSPALRTDKDGVYENKSKQQFKPGMYIVRLEPSSVPFNSLPLIWNLSDGQFIWLGPDEPLDQQSTLANLISKIECWRNREIRAHGYTGDKQYKVSGLIDGCRLDYDQRIEGGYLKKLSFGLQPTGVLEAINRCWPDAPIDQFSDHTLQILEQDNPICFVEYCNVRAPNHEAAVKAVEAQFPLLFAALSINRNATPRAVAFLTHHEKQTQLSLKTQPNSSSLTPGFSPGVSFLMERFKTAISKEPWIEFASGLITSLRNQESIEAKIFLAWSFVEAAAKRRVPGKKLDILDLNGKQLRMWSGRKITQEQDIGRVLVYLRDCVKEKTEYSGFTFPNDFETQLLLVYDIRNKIAHEGGVLKPSEIAPSAKLYDIAHLAEDWANESFFYETTKGLQEALEPRR